MLNGAKQYMPDMQKKVSARQIQKDAKGLFPSGMPASKAAEQSCSLAAEKPRIF
jgi:hypothetical protein